MVPACLLHWVPDLRLGSRVMTATIYFKCCARTGHFNKFEGELSNRAHNAQQVEERWSHARARSAGAGSPLSARQSLDTTMSSARGPDAKRM